MLAYLFFQLINLDKFKIEFKGKRFFFYKAVRFISFDVNHNIYNLNYQRSTTSGDNDQGIL